MEALKPKKRTETAPAVHGNTAYERPRPIPEHVSRAQEAHLQPKTPELVVAPPEHTPHPEAETEQVHPEPRARAEPVASLDVVPSRAGHTSESLNGGGIFAAAIVGGLAAAKGMGLAFKGAYFVMDKATDVVVAGVTKTVKKGWTIIKKGWANLTNRVKRLFGMGGAPAHGAAHGHDAHGHH